MVLNRVGPDDNRHVRIFDLIKCCGHRARADVLDQRRNRRRVAKTRAVVDVVVEEALTNEFLEQIGFFVRTFRRTESSNRTPTVLRAQACEPLRGNVHCLFPSRFTEMGRQIARIDVQPLRRCIFATDKWFRQAMWVVDIVKTKAPFDAQAAFVCGAVDTLDELHLVVFDFQRDLTAHTTERAHAFGFRIIIRAIADLSVVDNGRRHQCARRTSLNAFTASHTG